jgi:hypothetical protein
MKGFFRGVLCGIAVCAAIAACYLFIRFFYERDKAIIENLEAQNELQIMREDYGNRNADSFLLDNSAVLGAAENGIERFQRKRDEVIRRIRGNQID